MAAAKPELPVIWHFRLGILLTAVVTLGIAGFGGVYTWVWVPLALAIYFAVALLCLAATWQRRPLPLFALMLPAAGYAGLVAWQWAGGHSLAPASTLTALLQLSLGGGVLYLSLLAMRSRKVLRWTGFYLWGLTAALAGEAICQYFTANGKIYWVRDATYASPMGPFVYHNHFAGCLVLLVPASVAVAFRVDHTAAMPWMSWVRRGTVPLLALVAMVVSRSRGGMLALLGEALVAGVLWWRPSRRSLLAPATLVGVALLMAAALLADWQPLLGRFADLTQHDASAIERLQMGESCLAIWRSYPWLGTGFGTFASVYPQFQTFDNGLDAQYAHDEYAQGLAETGAVGAGLVLLFLAGGIWSWRRPRPELSRLERNIRRAAAVGAAGFLLQCAVDFEFHAPGLMILFFLLCGAAAAGPRAPGRARVGEAEMPARDLATAAGASGSAPR